VVETSMLFIDARELSECLSDDANKTVNNRYYPKGTLRAAACAKFELRFPVRQSEPEGALA
jgi:hypothetical protein